MKRFWTSVSVGEEGGAWGVRLDGRPVKTPARLPLHVPTRALAEAIGEEWNALGTTIDPRALPLTGIANAALDRVAPDQPSFAAALAKYAQADLACYRAEGPETLVRRQEREWDKLLGWARRRYDVDFVITSGLTHVEQPAATVDRLTHAISVLDPFRLAGLSPLVTLSGSLVAALGILERAMAPDEIWDAVSLDEQWQLERWGADAEAEAALHNRRRDFFSGVRFLDLL